MEKGVLPVLLMLLCTGVFSQDSLKTTQLEEVVVTGQFEPQSARKSVYQVRTIPMEMLEARGAVRLQDVLNTELNIRFSQDMALGGSNLTMQGLSGQNVKVLIDGVPLVGRQGTSNEININQINVNAIERIEIIEGPMSVVYGADALAGVINIITKKSVDKKLEASLKLHEESVGTEYGVGAGIHNQALGIGYSSGHFRYRADFNHNYFGGWQGSAAGRDKQWHPKKQFMAAGLAGFERGSTNVYYRLDYLFEDIYNPGVFQGGEALDQHYYTNRLMHQLQGGYSLSPKLQGNTAFSFTGYQRETQSTIVNETTGQRFLATGAGLQDETTFDGLTLRSTLQYRVNEKLSVQPGIDFNFESGSGGRIKEGTQHIGDYALFASAEWRIHPAIQIRPGLRLVYNTVYAAPPVIPSLNTRITINPKQDLRLSYGRGFRAPSLRELYFDFFDASHAIEGNTDLKAELSHSISGSWNFRFSEKNGLVITATVGGFYNTIENMIGYGQKPGNNLVTTYLNVERYKTTGITVGSTIKHKAVEAAGGLGYTGRYNQLSESFEQVNGFAWSPEATASVTYRFIRAGLDVFLNYKFTGKTPFYEIVTENGNQVPRLAEQDAFSWADLSAVKQLGKHISFTTGIRNLFDVTAVNNTSVASGVHSGGGTRPIGYGRSYFFSINYSLTK
ncbi:MAG: TonB-dependent receptor [Flammeovirgaceae bacterium]|nr:MAG: TonB-dependent receptor [Flammeovirgaceae bacterium]